MKGLILCAGRGTRLYPFSYSQPKTLLPVANYPVLHYCIHKLLEIGIHEIGIVINPAQTQIMEYVGDGSQYQATITFIEQPKPLGIAHAVLLSRSFIQDSPFLLLLGDNLLMDSLHTLHRSFTQPGAEGALLLSEVDRPQDYGIAEIVKGKLRSVEEKPKEPKSNLAVIGAYGFRSSIFSAIEHLQPSARGEYEITDAIQALLDQEHHIAHAVTDHMYTDVGTIDRWLAANRWMLAHELGNQVKTGENSVLIDCELQGPVLIGKNCRIENCRIGPYVSIQDGVTLKNCALIENSILLEHSSLVNIDCEVRESVFGRHSTLTGRLPGNMGIFIVSDRTQIQLPANGERALR